MEVRRMKPVHLIDRPSAVCFADSARILFTDINRREGFHVSATLGMHHLNPVLNTGSLSQPQE